MSGRTPAVARSFFTRISQLVPAAIFALSVCVSGAEARRLALVVGNAQYDHVYSLKNAAKDARDIAAALERLDFEVTLLTDIDGADFWTQLEAFAADAETAESTLFYFSGHAFQLDGANYLVPRNASLPSRAVIPDQPWRLDKIIKKLEERNRQTLIFLDACRNNPLPVSQRGTSGQGLAKIETGSGTFAAFATQPNNVTSDGLGDNSPFTAALLGSIERKGITISDLMIDVRNRVEELTFGKQTPWDQSSLRAQFYFNPEVEQTAQLTQADYEMIAKLGPKERNRFLSMLTRAGLQIEDAEIADQIQAREVAINPGLIIEDVHDIGGSVTVPRSAEVARPADAPVTSAFGPDYPVNGSPIARSDATAAQFDQAGIVALARPVSRVRQPRDSQTAVVPVSRRPGEAAPPRLMERPEGEKTLKSNGPTAASEAPVRSVPIGQHSGLLNNSPIPGAGFYVASAQPAPAPGMARVDSDDLPIVLAATEPDGVLAPASALRRRVTGADLDPLQAERLGITIPGGPELTGPALSRAVQQELARLGCYRMRVDGQFGKGSQLALLRYYGNKGIAPEEPLASNALLSVLRAERQVICKGATIQYQRVARAKKTITTKRRSVVTPASVQRPASQSTSAKRKITTTRTVTTKSGKSTQKKVTRMNTGVFR